MNERPLFPFRFREYSITGRDIQIFLLRLAALALVLAAAGFAFSSCPVKTSSAGIFVYNEADPFMHEFAGQIVRQAKGRFATNLYYANNSQLIQNEQIEAELANKSGIMLVNPVDRLGAFAIVRKMQAENIPVIFFNREPLAADLDLWDRTYYVGARPEQSGQLQAQVVMDLFGGNPAKPNEYDRNADGVIQAVLFKGEQGHQDAETRTAEVIRSFAASGWKVEILGMEIANWSRDEAYSKAGRLLAGAKNRIELVLSNNDDMALGVISRMRQEGWFKDSNGNGRIDPKDSSWIPVVGIDGLAEARESIAEGYLYGTVKNNSMQMAASMVELTEFLLGEREEEDLSVPLTDGKYIWIDYQPYISR